MLWEYTGTPIVHSLWQLKFLTASVPLVPEQRDQLPSDKWTFFGELSNPGGIVADEDGFIYVSDFVQASKVVIL